MHLANGLMAHLQVIQYVLHIYVPDDKKDKESYDREKEAIGQPPLGLEDALRRTGWKAKTQRMATPGQRSWIGCEPSEDGLDGIAGHHSVHRDHFTCDPGTMSDHRLLDRSSR